MQDARISIAFPSHPKTKKLQRRLGDSGPLACIYLILWTAANRSDGDLSGMTDEDIELAIDWRGDPGALIDSMAEVGFLEGEEGARAFHDWQDHNPWAAGAEARSEKSRWAALCRRHGRKEAARLMPDYAQRLLLADDSTATGSHEQGNGLPKPANGMRVAPKSPAPSPSPSPIPSPSPSPRAEQKAPAEPADFRAELFRRWKALPDAGGGAFLVKLLKDHKPEQRVLEAVERTLEETRADPKAFVLGVLRKEAKAEDDYDLLMARVR